MKASQSNSLVALGLVSVTVLTLVTAGRLAASGRDMLLLYDSYELLPISLTGLGGVDRLELLLEPRLCRGDPSRLQSCKWLLCSTFKYVALMLLVNCINVRLRFTGAVVVAVMVPTLKIARIGMFTCFRRTKTCSTKYFLFQ